MPLLHSPKELHDWSPWRSLLAGSDKGIPTLPGLYRIRRVGAERLDYVGQTGRSLRGRLAMLKGVFGPIMPYNDPHTAGPGFWALRQEGYDSFEVSTVAVSRDAPDRKSLESLTITMHRLECGESPTLNFGRMPVGWKKSSSNTRQLVAAGKRFRGGRDDAYVPPPSLRVQGPIDVPPQNENWIGLNWSRWTAFDAESELPNVQGLYRIAPSDGSVLTYVGQGLIRSRVRAHRAKVSDSDSRQGAAFGESGLRVSWAARTELASTQMLEVENDLIAAHFLAIGSSPSAQFLG